MPSCYECHREVDEETASRTFALEGVVLCHPCSREREARRWDELLKDHRRRYYERLGIQIENNREDGP